MSNSKPKLADEIEELEKLVEWFEQDDLDVEQAIAKYEQGAKLAETIRTQLTAIENKITVLETRFDQSNS